MLYLKELKKVVFSLLFVIYAAGAFIMQNSQDAMDFRGEKLSEPVEGEDYGMHPKEDPEVIMENAWETLYGEFLQNMYIAYPIGFYKEVRLNEKEMEEMAAVLENLTGMPAKTFLSEARQWEGDEQFYGGFTISAEETTKNPDGSYSYAVGEEQEEETADQEDITLKDGLTYEEFKENMEEADRIIGGGSNYRTDNLSSFCMVPYTYEEAMEQYELTKNTDRFTGGYARLFCDYYIVVPASLLPVFLAVALFLKDRQAHMETLLYTRRISSARLILSRYAALITGTMVPALVLGYISNSSVWGMYPGENLDYLAMLKYSVIWLLPTVMTVTGAGMFFTVLTDTPAAILVQVLWWFFDMNQGIWEKNGCALFRLMPRHNTLVGTQEWVDHIEKFAANRIFFTCFALLLVLGTIFIYEQKRRGRLYGKKIGKKMPAFLGHRKSKYKA